MSPKSFQCFSIVLPFNYYKMHKRTMGTFPHTFFISLREREREYSGPYMKFCICVDFHMLIKMTEYICLYLLPCILADTHTQSICEFI